MNKKKDTLIVSNDKDEYNSFVAMINDEIDKKTLEIISAVCNQQRKLNE